MFDVLLAFPVLLLALGLGAACSFGKGCIGMNFDRLGLVLIALGAVTAAGMCLFLKISRVRDPEEPARLSLRTACGAAFPACCSSCRAWSSLLAGQGPQAAP